MPPFSNNYDYKAFMADGILAFKKKKFFFNELLYMIKRSYIISVVDIPGRLGFVILGCVMIAIGWLIRLIDMIN